MDDSKLMETVEDILKEEKRVRGIIESIFSDWTLIILKDPFRIHERFEFILKTAEILDVKKDLYEIGDDLKFTDQSYFVSKQKFNKAFEDLYFLIKRGLLSKSFKATKFWSEKLIPAFKELIRIIPFPVEFQD